MTRRKQNAIKAEFHDQAVNPESRSLEDFLKTAALDDMVVEELRQESMCLNLLRTDEAQEEPSPGFTERTIRRIRISREQATLRYWSPAICGAVVAVLILAAVLQVFSTPEVGSWKNPTSEARLTRDSQSPLSHSTIGTDNR